MSSTSLPEQYFTEEDSDNVRVVQDQHV